MIDKGKECVRSMGPRAGRGQVVKKGEIPGRDHLPAQHVWRDHVIAQNKSIIT